MNTNDEQVNCEDRLPDINVPVYAYEDHLSAKTVALMQREENEDGWYWALSDAPYLFIGNREDENDFEPDDECFISWWKPIILPGEEKK